MKKITAIMLCLVLGLLLTGCSPKDTDTSPTSKWDCSVRCAKESAPDKYCTTYSDVKAVSKTGTLTIQNRNNFDICRRPSETAAEDIIPGQVRTQFPATFGHNRRPT